LVISEHISTILWQIILKNIFDKFLFIYIKMVKNFFFFFLAVDFFIKIK